jgi:hypothetical protein
MNLDGRTGYQARPELGEAFQKHAFGVRKLACALYRGSLLPLAARLRCGT